MEINCCIPTEEDCLQLEAFLGVPVEELQLTASRGETVNAGRKMKSTAGWEEPNRGATNESGF